jgi:phosphate transport system substrate-binding protein
MKNRNNFFKSTKLFYAALGISAVLSTLSFMTNEKQNGDPSLKGAINISGTRFLYPLIEKWAVEFKRENPGVEFVIKSGVENRDIDASAAPVKKLDSSRGQYTVVSRFALVPITNEKNPAVQKLLQTGITKEDFLKIYFRSEKKGNKFDLSGNKDIPLNVYTRNACASATFTDHFSKSIKDLENVGGKIEDDQVLLETVLKDSLGIAYNNLGFVYDLRSRKQKAGLVVIPIDLNGNGILDKDERFYSSLDELLKHLAQGQTDLPPTGDLTFIYKDDKPQVKAFVKWILEKGQEFNQGYGFLSIPPKAK